MGSETFTNVGYGKTASEAYNALVDEARYEYGHDPYNGTISTTHGFIIKPLGQKRFTDKAIDRWIDKAHDATDKFEPCWCLELPKTHPLSKGKGRGVRAFIFTGWVHS